MATPPQRISITGDNNNTDLILSSESSIIADNANLVVDAQLLTRINALEGSLTLNEADIKNIKSGISVSTSAVVTISNDLFVRGKITEYSGNDPSFVDYWSGIWESGFSRNFILVLEKDQTYTLWGPNDNNNYGNAMKFPFIQVMSGLKWSFSKIETDKKIAMAISPAISELELETEFNNGSNIFLIKTMSPGESYTSSDPVKFIEEYNRQAGELIMKRAFNLDTVFDLKNTWTEMRNLLNQTDTGQKTLKFMGSGRKIQTNMNQKSFIELSALHDKLATSTIDYNYKIIRCWYDDDMMMMIL